MFSPFGTIEFTQKQFRPWLDHDDGGNVLFTSVHLFDNEGMSSSSQSCMNFGRSIFFPGTGDIIENTPDSDEIYPGGIFNVPVGLG